MVVPLSARLNGASPCLALPFPSATFLLPQQRKPFNVIGFLKTPYGMMGGAQRRQHWRAVGVGAKSVGAAGAPAVAVLCGRAQASVPCIGGAIALAEPAANLYPTSPPLLSLKPRTPWLPSIAPHCSIHGVLHVPAAQAQGGPRGVQAGHGVGGGRGRAQRWRRQRRPEPAGLSACAWGPRCVRFFLDTLLWGLCSSCPASV